MSDQYETGRVKLQIRSQHFYTNYINNITPAEFLMLRHVHGPHAPTLIEVQGNAVNTRMSEGGKWLKRPLRENELREKLTLKYKEKAVKEVFPGAGARLPLTFAEIGVKANPQPEDDVASQDEGWEPMSSDEIQDMNLPQESPEANVDDLLGPPPEKEKKPAKKRASKKKAG